MFIGLILPDRTPRKVWVRADHITAVTEMPKPPEGQATTCTVSFGSGSGGFHVLGSAEDVLDSVTQVLLEERRENRR